MQIKVKRADGRSPIEWDAVGASAAEILDNWARCFGVAFVQVDPKTGRAMQGGR